LISQFIPLIVERRIIPIKEPLIKPNNPEINANCNVINALFNRVGKDCQNTIKELILFGF